MFIRIKVLFNIFLAKSVIDPEKTTTANCPQIKTCKWTTKKETNIFSSWNNNYSHHKLVASMCTLTGSGPASSLSSALTSGTFSNKLSSSRSMSSCMTEALIFSLGAVVAVAQQSHNRKKIDKNSIEVKSQKGRPDRCETQCNHWRPLSTTLLG